jgi:hypothetical protein
MKHRCGGELQPQKVRIRKKIGYTYQSFTVDGYKCDYCGEEIISRDIAYAIDQSIEQLKQLWRHWKVSGDTKTTPSYSSPPSGTFIREPLFEDSTYDKSIY